MRRGDDPKPEFTGREAIARESAGMRNGDWTAENLGAIR
jgi:hypothetical protein